MKKRTAFAVLSVACLLLTGCGKDDSSAAESSTAAEVTAAAAQQEKAENSEDSDAAELTTGETVTESAAETETTASAQKQEENPSKPANGSGASVTLPAGAFEGCATPEEAAKAAMDAYIAADAVKLFACLPQCFAESLGEELQGAIAYLQAEFDEEMEDDPADHVFTYELKEQMTFAEADAKMEADDTFEYSKYDDSEDAQESVEALLKGWSYHGEAPEYCVVHIVVHYPEDDEYENWEMGLVTYKIGDRWYDTISAEYVENSVQNYVADMLDPSPEPAYESETD